MTNNTADKFSMLFSADWFGPYWHVTGFKAEPGLDHLFQQEMRSLVKAMIGDADQYWHATFTEQRIEETRSALLDSLRRHAARDSDLRLIEGDVYSKASDEVVAEIAERNWGEYEDLLLRLKTADLEGTEWDLYLVQLTPDLPTLTQDFALQTVRFS